MKGTAGVSGVWVGGLLALVLVPTWVQAQAGLVQNGVGDDRVSLPDGPGSREGMGANASVTGNQGQMTYSVPVEVRQGFPMATPSMALQYNSGSGTGLAGMGWTVEMPAVERMTSRGLPTYTTSDAFTASDELVAIPGTNPPVYRARFEGGFVRYTWLNAGSGAEGYWKAELPDGVVQYYGADASGTLVPAARVGTASGTFRYHLVESVDPFGHKVTWHYVKQGAYALPDEVGWLHNDQGVAQATVQLVYEAREDLISDCKAGFELVLAHRLKTVRSRSGTSLLLRYELSYEPYATSGGSSRLLRVQAFAADNRPAPGQPSFTYTRALGGACTSSACGLPFTRSMGSIGVSLQARTATLIDLNGDALPDLLETPNAGPHRIRLASLAANGTHTFLAAVESAVTQSSSFRLNDASVQLLDLDGDGLTDMVNARTGGVLINGGNGDWLMADDLGGAAVVALPNFDADAMDGERSIRFLDYDNDKRIDVIQATQAATTIFRNTGVDFVQDMGVEAIGRGFQEDNLQLADMNGDGLLDAVTVAQGVVSYRLNLGRGRWAPAVDITGLPLSGSDVDLAELSDINGDGTADLLVVSGTEVRVAINKNGTSFLSAERITSTEVPGIPERLSTTTVLTADMNGNGSTDVVWVGGDGTVTYLELFPVRPNLISRIENGRGMVTTVEYMSAVEQMAAATGADAWTSTLPNSTLVVSYLASTEGVGNVVQDERFTYRNAYYDGTEKQFRGFGTVITESEADASQEASRTVSTYDLGITDRYRAGRVLTVDEWSGTRPIRSVTNTYSDCPVEGVPADLTPYAVRHVCLTQTDTVHKEGAPPEQWVTTRDTSAYDGYGQVTLSTQHGVVSVGGGACAACSGATDDTDWGTPCGMMCLGDERFNETSYAAPTPTGRWILGLEVTHRSYAVAGGTASETSWFYDGPDFTGLAAGQFDRGLVTRVLRRRATDAPDHVTWDRTAYNAHGQPTVALDPLGSPTSPDHRRTYTYDETGLNMVAVDVHTTDADGAPYQLRRTFTYEPVFNALVSATSWRVVRNGVPQGASGDTFLNYDPLNRLVSVVRPGGDTTASPTEELSYEDGNPVSTVTTRSRITAGQAAVETKVTCLDGMGRTFQERRQTGPDRWLVDGFTTFNGQGEAVSVHYAYTSTRASCELAPPASVRATRMKMDGTGRVTEIIHPDGADFGGTDSSIRVTFLPLAEVTSDEADHVAGHPNEGTPMTLRRNGLGNPVAVERLTAAGATPTVTRFHYDALGFVAGVTDPLGNRKTQTRDLLGRVLRIEDPDAGTTTFQHDDAGNTVRVQDARGVVLRSTFDGLNRLRSRWQDGQQAQTEVAYTYDQPPMGCPAQDCSNVAGQVASVSFPLDGNRATDWFGYDARMLLRHTTRQMMGAVLSFTSERDNLSRVRRKTYPGNRALTFERDMAGRVTAIPGFAPSIRYDDAGLLSSVVAANGVTRTTTRDTRERTAGLSYRRADGSVVAEHTYRWDRHEQLREVLDGRPEDNLPHGNVVYTHDGFGRVTRMAFDTARAAHAETLDLTYDALDNVLSRTSSLGAASPAHVGTYSYGGNGAGPRAVTSAGGTSYAYDAAGHMTARGTQTLVTDHLGRLARVEERGQALVQFGYGAEQGVVLRRQGASVLLSPADDYEVRDGVSALTVSLGPVELAVSEKVDLQTALYSDVAPATVTTGSVIPSPDGTISAADAWLAYAAGTVLPALGVASASNADELLMASARRLTVGTATVDTFVHTDRVGSTLAVTDTAGTVLQRSEFYGFGLERLSGAAMRERMTFTGHEVDAAGLIHHGVRALDPRLGRWTSVDPTFAEWNASTLDPEGLDDALNAYAYARNRFGQAMDATGREALDEPADVQGEDADVTTGTGDKTSESPATTRSSSESATASHQGSTNRPRSDSDLAVPSEGGGQPKRIKRSDITRAPGRALQATAAVAMTLTFAVIGLFRPLAIAAGRAARAPGARLKSFFKGALKGYLALPRGVVLGIVSAYNSASAPWRVLSNSDKSFKIRWERNQKISTARADLKKYREQKKQDRANARKDKKK